MLSLTGVETEHLKFRAALVESLRSSFEIGTHPLVVPSYMDVHVKVEVTNILTSSAEASSSSLVENTS